MAEVEMIAALGLTGKSFYAGSSGREAGAEAEDVVSRRRLADHAMCHPARSTSRAAVPAAAQSALRMTLART